MEPQNQNKDLHINEGEEQPLANGPVLILLVVLLVVLLGSMVYWYSTLGDEEVITPTYTRPTAEENNEPESTTAEAQTRALGTMSTSDDLGAIEADLESTDTASLDSEMTTIENEINATQ